MTHPHLLHARRALWDLARLQQPLRDAAIAEDTAIWTEQRTLDQHDGVRSAGTAGPGPVGTHSDPVAAAALGTLTRRPRTNRFQVLAESCMSTMDWLADAILGSRWQLDDGLTRLIEALPELAPSSAGQVALWADDHASRIRDALSGPPAAVILSGAVACPACGVRLLYAHLAGPGDAWTVTCRPDCACTGEPCPCGMDVRAAGVPHIWDAAPWMQQINQARAKIGAA